MRSYAFDSFYDSYFGDPYMSWHDGLDETALLSLEGEEREEAERLLLERLKTNDNDRRASSGLAALRSQKAVPDLKKKLSEAWGDNLVETAHALWEIEQYPPAAAMLIELLENGAYWTIRKDAAKALVSVETEESIAALWKAMDDPEDVVRSEAVLSLMELHGIQKDDYGTHPLAIAMMSEDEGERKKAREELKVLIDATR